MGYRLISNDALAMDVVASHIMNYHPEEVPYMPEAKDRGYGSIDINDINIMGDASIEVLTAVTTKLHSPFQDLQELGTPLKFYEGNLKQSKKGAIVMGFYDGDVLHPGETVALIGDCAGVSGRLEAVKVIKVKGCPVKVADLMIKTLPPLRPEKPGL